MINLVGDIKSSNSDINIYIGKENNLDEDMTVIETSYKTPQEEGKLVVIGPKRMEYDRVVSLLEFIKENIEK
jgi:heat-inducible transcriptional repressor